jgi:hapalindole H/12-epi-hapalindole U/12-epi-fischerindole U synthase
MDNPGNQSQFASIESGLVQTLSATLQTNTLYTLTVEVGNMAIDSSPSNNFAFTGFPGYRVDLLAAGQVIASDNNTLLLAEGTFRTSQFSLSVGASHVLAGQSLGIRLVNLNAGPGIEVNFDDVRLDATAIPEPGTFASLLGVATLALAVRRRKI